MPQVKRSLTWAKHFDRWKNCTACDLYHGRKRVVLARGQIPADVLWVGEAPGASEDVMGSPFEGPAGQMLDDFVADAGFGEWRSCFSNLVGCLPLDEEGSKAGEPPDESIKACAPRLGELVQLCLRRTDQCMGLQLVVCVGTLAAKWVRKLERYLQLEDVRKVDIVHPGAILRAPTAQKSLLIQRNHVVLRNAAADMIPF